MERRAYFVLGDLATNVLAGGSAGLAARAAISGESWLAPLAMIVGVLIGCIIGVVISIAFLPLFGAFEVMLPTTLSAMAAGMFIATYHAWYPTEAEVAVGAGAVLGVVSIAATYVLNAYLCRRGSSYGPRY